MLDEQQLRALLSTCLQQDSHWLSLSQTTTSRSWLVTSPDTLLDTSINKQFIVRQAWHAYFQQPGSQFSYAINIQQRASEIGLAPELVFSDAEHCVSVSCFVEGDVLPEQHLQKRATLTELAKTLRQLHALGPAGAEFELLNAAKFYHSSLQLSEHKKRFADRCVEEIERCTPEGPWVNCHNDLVAKNIINTDPMLLIDWEYAADNDPFFDLASLVAYHELDDAIARSFLEAYLNAAPSSKELAHFSSMRKVYDCLQWLWYQSLPGYDLTKAEERKLSTIEVSMNKSWCYQ